MKKLLVFIAVFIGIGCQKTNVDSTTTGNPMVSLAVTGSSQQAQLVQQDIRTIKNIRDFILNLFLKPVVALPPPSMVDSQGNVVTLTSAWMVVKEIEFKEEEAAAGTEEAEIEFEGPYIVDLLDSAPSALGSAQISSRAIRRIKMKLHPVEESLPADAPIQLSGNSIYFQGTVLGNAITFYTSDGAEYEVGGSNSISPVEGDSLLLSIKLASIIKKINFSSISTSTTISDSSRVSVSNPCPLIDSSASDLYTCFRKGIESEAQFGKDDGDYEFDEDDETVN